MNRTSRDTERQIFLLHFQGYSNHEIASNLGTPATTVSDVLSILPETVTSLRDLSRDLRKQGLTIFEAKRATQLGSRLADLGISFDQLQSYLEFSEKISADSDYEPRQIVEAEMRLNALEEVTGKTYPEVLLDFEEKASDNKELEMRMNQLMENANVLETEKKQKLAENSAEEKEIAYIINLRKNLHKHGIRLNDVENLEKYLENMKETGSDPRTFVEYTKEHDSLNRRTTLLRQEEEEHARNLRNLEEKGKRMQIEINENLSVKSELDKKISEAHINLGVIQKEIEDASSKEAEELIRLGHVLNVRAKETEIGKALANRQEKGRRLDVENAEKEAHGRELDSRNKNLETEIAAKLRINNYSTELLSAVADLEQKKLALTNEESQKQERLAFADTITIFFLEGTFCNFDLFYSYVQKIKRERETRTFQPYQVASTEERTRQETRDLALKVFAKDIVSKREHKTLQDENEKCMKTKLELEKKISILERDVADANNRAASALADKKAMEAIRVTVGGRSVTLEELRKWLLSVFKEEIDTTVNQRLEALRIGALNLIDYAWKKLTQKGEGA